MTKSLAAWSPERRLLLPAVAAAALALVWAALEDRALYADGAAQFYHVLNLGRPFHDAAFMRYTEMLLQLPAVAWLRVVPGDPGIAGALRLLSFCYFLHPLASLAACAAIVQSRRAPRDGLLFALMSLGLATFSTIGFAQGVAPISLSLFWPLFFLLQSPLRARAAHAGAWLLLAGVVFGYEGAIFVLPPVAWSAWRSGGRALAVAATLGFGSVVGRVAFGSPGNLPSTLQSGLGAYPSITLGFALVALLLLAIHRYGHADWRAQLHELPILLGIGACIWLTYYFDRDQRAYRSVLGSAYLARVTAMPVAAAIAAAMLALTSGPARPRLAPTLRYPLAALAATALWMGAVYDGLGTWQWRADLALARRIAETHPGPCRVIPVDELRRLGGARIPTWSFHFMTALSWRSEHPRSLVMVDDSPVAGDPARLCRPRGDAERPYLATDLDVRLYPRAGRFRYGKSP